MSGQLTNFLVFGLITKHCKRGVLRPVYTTEKFWHGSGEIGTGAKKVLDKPYLHYYYTIFGPAEVTSKDGRRSLRAVSNNKYINSKDLNLPLIPECCYVKCQVNHHEIHSRSKTNHR